MSTIITVKEAAELLGVKTNTVYWWCRRGIVPYTTDGRWKILIDRDAMLDRLKKFAISTPKTRTAE